MANGQSDYQVGPGKPPLHARFKKRQSGNPRGRSPKKLPALLADALNERFWVTIDGKRRKITKREAIVTQMVNKSRSDDSIFRSIALMAVSSASVCWRCSRSRKRW